MMTIAGTRSTPFAHTMIFTSTIISLVAVLSICSPPTLGISAQTLKKDGRKRGNSPGSGGKEHDLYDEDFSGRTYHETISPHYYDPVAIEQSPVPRVVTEEFRKEIEYGPWAYLLFVYSTTQSDSNSHKYLPYWYRLCDKISKIPPPPSPEEEMTAATEGVVGGEFSKGATGLPRIGPNEERGVKCAQVSFIGGPRYEQRYASHIAEGPVPALYMFAEHGKNYVKPRLISTLFEENDEFWLTVIQKHIDKYDTEIVGGHGKLKLHAAFDREKHEAEEKKKKVKAGKEDSYYQGDENPGDL